MPNLVDIVHHGPSGRTVRLVPMDDLLRSFSEAGGQGFGEDLVVSRFKRASPFQTFIFYGFFPRWTCERTQETIHLACLVSSCTKSFSFPVFA